jgi:hypothetical protein
MHAELDVAMGEVERSLQSRAMFKHGAALHATGGAPGATTQLLMEAARGLRDGSLPNGAAVGLSDVAAAATDPGYEHASILRGLARSARSHLAASEATCERT